MVNPEQASAFCAWLTRRRGELGTFRLPTTTEWLIAAYGRDRAYPWVDEANEARYHRSPFHSDQEEWDVRSAASRAKLNAELGKRPPPTPPLPAPEPLRGRPNARTPEGLYGMWGNVAELVIPDERRENRYVLGLGAKWMGGTFDDVRYERRRRTAPTSGSRSSSVHAVTPPLAGS